MNSRILIFTLISLTLYSCKKEVLKFKFTEKNKLNVSELDFNYFQARTRLSFDDGYKSMNASANIRIKKDSIIWISISPAIGIEAFRAMIRKDSAFIIDRINNTYDANSIDVLKDKYNIPFDFNTLQAVLLGNLIEKRNKEDRVVKNDGFFVLRQNNSNLVIYNYVNNKTMKIEKVSITEDPGTNNMEIVYKDFQFVRDRLFPHENKIQIFKDKEKTSVSKEMTIAFNRITVDDKSMKFPFKVPDKYLTDD